MNPLLPELPLIDLGEMPVDPPPAAPTFPLRQSWRSEPEPEFRPAAAWLAATSDAFLIWAALQDSHPRTTATADHQHLWLMGDVFEIFLQPAGAVAYSEFQIAPTGHVLHLHYPHGGRAPDGNITPFIRRPHGLDVKVQTRRGRGIWNVRVRLPFAALNFPPQPVAQAWHISFARYDYRDDGIPCYACSSPLTEPDFHRKEAWLPVELPSPVPA